MNRYRKQLSLAIGLSLVSVSGYAAEPSPELVQQTLQKCPYFLFYGQAQKSDEEVLVCVEKGQLHFQFGQISERGEVYDRKVAKENVRYFYRYNESYIRSQLQFETTEHHYRLTVHDRIDPTQLPMTKATLTITTGNHVMTLPLRQNTVVSDITPDLSESGFIREE